MSPRQELALALEAVLDDGREEIIHQFILRNPTVLAVAPRSVRLWSKFRLGTNFATDFLCFGEQNTNAVSPLITMIEIERADRPIFTASGDPAAILTHAVRQVQDWKQWVLANREYLARDILDRWADSAPVGDDNPRFDEDFYKQRLLRHFAVFYYVIVGRRTSLRVPELLRLEQMNEDLSNIQIITYDVLIQALLGGSGERFYY